MSELWRDQFKAVYVSPEVHRKLAILAATQGRHIKEVAEEAIASHLASLQTEPPKPPAPPVTN